MSSKVSKNRIRRMVELECGSVERKLEVGWYAKWKSCREKKIRKEKQSEGEEWIEEIEDVFSSLGRLYT